MVQGTAHGVAHDQAFCERATVVGAVGADGKDLITAAGQNQFFAVGLARYHAAIAEIANRKSISEIGFVRLWCLCHDFPPEPNFDTAVDSSCWLSSNRWFGSYYSRTARVSQTSRRLEVTSRPTTWAHSHLAHRLRPRQASLQEQALYHNSVSLMRAGKALHDNQRRISQC